MFRVQNKFQTNTYFHFSQIHCFVPGVILPLHPEIYTYNISITKGETRNVIILVHKFLFYNKFIIFLYMFPALLCSSSGGQNCIIQHLVSSHSVGGCPVHSLGEDCARDDHLQCVMIPDAVQYNFDLLMMSTIMLKTCRGI